MLNLVLNLKSKEKPLWCIWFHVKIYPNQPTANINADTNTMLILKIPLESIKKILFRITTNKIQQRPAVVIPVRFFKDFHLSSGFKTEKKRRSLDFLFRTTSHKQPSVSMEIVSRWISLLNSSLKKSKSI